MSYLEKPLTRREFIGTAILGAGSLGSASTIAGYDLYKQINEVHLRPHEIPDFKSINLPVENEIIPLENDRSPDPLFRAATVGFGNPDQSYGHGSIINLNGEFQIYTVEHVVRAMERHGNLITIPGVGATQIQAERIITLDSASKNDTPAFYILGEKMQQKITDAARDRIIFPLTLNHNLPQNNEQVLVPSTDTNSYMRYRVKRFIRNENQIQLQASERASENCAGDSGSPILRITRDKSWNEYITGETYGVLSGSNMLYPTEKGKECAKVFVATINSNS